MVVIGVAVTFIGSNWISNRQEEAKLREHLDAVKIELEDNLEEIRNRQLYYERLARLIHYLESDEPQNLSQDKIDSLNNYPDMYLIGGFFTVASKTSAFEMLKSSGAMNRIKDPKVSQAILDCYTSIETAKQQSDYYMTAKMNELRSEIMNTQQLFFGNILHPDFRRLFYFFAAYVDFENLFRNSARQVEETLELL